jgi:hypothetical protein
MGTPIALEIAAALWDHKGTLYDLFGLTHPFSRYVTQVSNFMYPNVLPDPMSVYKAHKAGLIGSLAVESVWNAAGQRYPMDVDPARGAVRGPTGWADAWSAVAAHQVTIPGTGELLTLLNLNKIDRPTFDTGAKFNGWWNTDWLDRMVWLSQNLVPSPPELVSFALRDAWNADVVARFDYDAEFPPEFSYWMKKLGADGDATVPADAGGGGNAATWAKLYWRVHWSPISPTQSYEMYQRLRPNRLARFGADFAGMRAFTIDDVRMLLRINDYPKPFRDQLAAIAFRRPRLVDIDRFFGIGLIDRDEVKELHLDLGYSPADAEMRTQWLVQQTQQTKQPKAQKRLPAKIARLYSLGRISRWDAQTRILQVLTNDPASAFELEPAEADRRRIWLQGKADTTAILAEADLNREQTNTTRLLGAWRRRFLRGIQSGDQIRTDMVNAGWQAGWVDQWLATLRTELAGGRLLASTGQIKRWFVDGILPMETAKSYLANLGWHEPELGWLLSEFRRDYDLEQARIAERLARSARSRAAAQANQAQQLDRARRQVIARLNRQATPQLLHRYYIRGVISDEEYKAELGQRGLDATAVSRAIEVARQDRADYLAAHRTRPRPSRAAQPAAGS